MNDITKYHLSGTGNTESFISIELIECIYEIDTLEFIKKYKISNYWSGKIFIKRLINKIFKYKLNQKMIWNSRFWKEINIHTVNSKLNIKNGKSINDLIMELNSKRKKDVMKYQLMMKENIDLGYPLFITGKCLKKIGGIELNEKKIYMLDGSRRLIASVLNGLKEIKILLISS